MKRQQRSFVVEVKSSRGRQTTRPKSIWGDVNLKAFAAETDSHQHPLGIADSKSDLGAGRQESSVGSSSEVHVGTTAEVVKVDGEVKAPLPALGIVELENEQTSRPTVASPVSTPEVALPPTETRPGTLRVGRNHARLNREDDVDQLAELEAENRRLKDLLRVRLLGDNNLLREMLARFGS